MKTAITTDTNSGIAQAEIQDPGLYVLPMPVIIEDEVFLEGINMDSTRLYEAMRQHKSISTSQPSPGQLTELWDGILREGYDEIVHIPMSSGLSGSCENAQRLSMHYEGKVQVADNHRISVTQRESVFHALRLARQGYDAKAIKERLEECAYNASIYIMVDSLEYLKRGGRITPAVSALATVLSIKPVLSIQGDKLDSYAKARGTVNAEKKMIEAIQRDRLSRFSQVPDFHLKIDVAGTLESNEKIQRWLLLAQREFPFAQITYVRLPCSIACHVGINAAGIAITQIMES